MCKFKDTNLGIKKLDFNVKRGAMAAYLTDGREIIVPVSMFPDIKHLTKKQREEWMIMDDQYFSRPVLLFRGTEPHLFRQRLAQTLNRLRHYTIKSLITNNKITPPHSCPANSTYPTLPTPPGP